MTGFVTCMNSLVSFQMRTLGVNFCATRMIAKMDPPLFQVGVVPSVVLDRLDESRYVVAADDASGGRGLTFKAAFFLAPPTTLRLISRVLGRGGRRVTRCGLLIRRGRGQSEGFCEWGVGLTCRGHVNTGIGR